MPKRRKAPKRKKVHAKARKTAAKKKGRAKLAKKSRAAKAKKTVKKAKRTKMTPKKKAGAFNRKSYWKAFKELEARADAAWEKFQTSVKNKAPAAQIARDRSELLLVLGECNYMAQECARLEEIKRLKKA